jgi:hypothetical protein
MTVGRNGGTTKRSGWHRGKARFSLRASTLRPEFEPEFARPARWDLLLRELGLSDERAQAAVRAGDGATAKRISGWVHENYTRAFVPSWLISALRLEAPLERHLARAVSLRVHSGGRGEAA